jgi:hypothetical protein
MSGPATRGSRCFSGNAFFYFSEHQENRKGKKETTGATVKIGAGHVAGDFQPIDASSL